jgi:uncharacterized protein YndB with AHSA1/START domain
MTALLSESAAGAAIAQGCVEVSLRVAAPAIGVWQALTEPASVARWFGALDSELRPHGTARFDFGDGDFFDLEVIRADPPTLLQYSWRFLGIGPLDTITWRIAQDENACLVIVTDVEPGRSREEAQRLRRGWLDFTRRLKNYLRTGKPTRYGWRQEFDAAIEIPGRAEDLWEALFHSEAQARWLPLEGQALVDGARISIDDSIEPCVFEVSGVTWSAPRNVTFRLTHEDWLHPTTCELALSEHGFVNLLSVSHNDWKTISPRKSYQKLQRERFSALWITTLKQARQLIERLAPA